MTVRQALTLSFAAALTLVLAACNRTPASHGHAGHFHEPPHGGTVLELGEEEAFLEFVHDAATEKLRCYVLAPHMAGFIRLPAESFEVTAKIGGRVETLTFKAVANAATGETVGDTAQFEAHAPWLKTAKKFDAELKRLTIRGKTYDAVPFRFPEGNYPRKAAQ